MDNRQFVETARAERTCGCEQAAEGNLEGALAHFRMAAAFYDGIDELDGEQKDEYVALLYDETDIMRSLGKKAEASVSLQKAWLISGTAAASRGRATALDVLKTEPPTHPFGIAGQPLRTTATYILGGLDLSHLSGDYALNRSELCYQTEIPGAKQNRGLSPWTILQLVILVIWLLIKLSSC